MTRIGVALSGGGHRATSWGLGALLALADSETNRQVVSVTSVSGGSIANGIAAQQGGYGSMTGLAFGEAIRPALRHVASEGLYIFGPATNGWLLRLVAAVCLFIDLAVALVVATVAAGRDWPAVWWLLLGLLLGGAAWLASARVPKLTTQLRVTAAAGLALSGPLAAVAVAVIASAGWLRATFTWAVLLVATVAALWVSFRLLAARSGVVDDAMSRTHFSDASGAPTLLANVVSDVHHVFCATELQAGDHIYFTPRLVYSFRVGRGRPGDLRLSTAVQCSCCLPGAFCPRTLDTSGFGLERPWEVPFNLPPAKPTHVVVNDGGVYDNMADQWEQGIERRVKRLGESPAVQEAAEELVVVNASAGMNWKPYPRGGALMDEVGGLSRPISIQYDVSTSHRRQGLVSRFQLAAETKHGLLGVIVNISQSPFDIPRAFEKQGGAPADRARKALAALGTLSRTPENWAALADSNAAVSTTLGALTVATTADLIEHAWVLTTVNVYVVLGHGEDLIDNLSELGSRARFVALCS